jgi:hypothetical protein
MASIHQAQGFEVCLSLHVSVLISDNEMSTHDPESQIHETKKQRVSNLNPSFVLYRSMSRWQIMSKHRGKQKTCLQRRGERLQ